LALKASRSSSVMVRPESLCFLRSTYPLRSQTEEANWLWKPISRPQPCARSLKLAYGVPPLKRRISTSA
jgi:hypothetical protein